MTYREKYISNKSLIELYASYLPEIEHTHECLRTIKEITRLTAENEYIAKNKMDFLDIKIKCHPIEIESNFKDVEYTVDDKYIYSPFNFKKSA